MGARLLWLVAVLVLSVVGFFATALLSLANAAPGAMVGTQCYTDMNEATRAICREWPGYTWASGTTLYVQTCREPIAAAGAPGSQGALLFFRTTRTTAGGGSVDGGNIDYRAPPCDTDEASLAAQFSKIGVTGPAIAFVVAWGFGAVVFMWFLGYGIGVALGLIRRA